MFKYVQDAEEHPSRWERTVMGQAYGPYYEIFVIVKPVFTITGGLSLETESYGLLVHLRRPAQISWDHRFAM